MRFKRNFLHCKTPSTDSISLFRWEKKNLNKWVHNQLEIKNVNNGSIRRSFKKKLVWGKNMYNMVAASV